MSDARKWTLVPVEPTEAMLLAMAAAPKWSWSQLTLESATERYRAMLDAAPQRSEAFDFKSTTTAYVARMLRERAAAFGDQEYGSRYYGKSDVALDEEAARKLEAIADDLAATEADATTLARHANEADTDADADRAAILNYLKNLPAPGAMDWTFYDAAVAIERGDHLLQWEDADGGTR